MTVYISGNSHAVALAEGLKARPDQQTNLNLFSYGVGNFEMEPMSQITNGQVAFSRPVLRRRMNKAMGQVNFIPGDTWGLVMGTHNSRIYGQETWLDCALAKAFVPGKRPISKDVLLHMILADQQHIRAFLSELKSTDVNVFVVSCPSPRRDGAAAKMGVPLETIALIDQIARSSFLEFLDEQQIEFVQEPENTVDEEGFLLDEYSRKVQPNGKVDPHHANAAYGELMIDKITEHLTPAQPYDVPFELEKMRLVEQAPMFKSSSLGIQNQTMRRTNMNQIISRISSRQRRVQNQRLAG